MQLYVLDRAKNTLATTASFYNDKHHKELTAGASIFEFTIDKSDSAAQYMTTGNYLVFLDDRGRAWSFTILSYDETQTTKTVAAEDVSIELLNKAMDIWNTDQAYPFSYYFNLVTKDTPWKLGVNQLTDLSRKLVYTGRDTGLGRLLSILKGFDNAECQFNVTVQQNKPVTFTVDVYKSIGTVQDNIQIVYNNELNDIKKTESHAQFVTALSGVGGLVENQATTDPGLEKHIDFADIDYKDDNFVSPKGDKFLRAVTANKTFNPGTTSYIEDFYDYDTQSAQELLNRTLTQLKERSEPQYTYNADVKVIDPTLDIGDTVTIIDHDYQPALYLSARVATLDKSYTDPTQGSITFCNYRVLNSTLSDQLRAMQNIIDKMPTSASVKLINSNIIKIIATNEELKKQVVLALKSADGKSTIYFDAKPSTAQDGDIAFIKNADGATEIWKFVEGAWKLDIGLATFEDVKKAASAAADAGSQAAAAGQQAIAAGSAAKSAGDFAASAASQATIETASAQSAANSAVDQANLAISQAGFANDAADQAKSAAASAQSDATDALAEATKSFNDAQNAISNATKAMDAAEQNHTTVTGLVTKVDDIAGTIQTLATTQSVDKLAGTVTTVQNLAQFASDGLKLKADSSTVSSLDGRVTKLSGQLDLQADKIAATVTANDVTGMLNGYATQSWSQGQISAAKNEISASVETVKNTVDNLQVGGRNYVLNSNRELNGGAEPRQELAWFTSSSDLDTAMSGKYVTVSFDIDVTNAVSGSLNNRAGVSFVFTRKDGSLFYIESWYDPTTYGVTFKGRVYHTLYVPNDAAGKVEGIGLYSQIQADSLILSRPKVSVSTVKDDWTQAPEDLATVDWTKSQLDIKDNQITAQISDVKDGLTTKFTTLQQTLNGVQATANNAVTQGQLTLLSDQFTSTITDANNAQKSYLFNTAQSFVTTKGPSQGPIAQTDLATMQKLRGKQVTISADIEGQNCQFIDGQQHRIVFKIEFQFTDGTSQYLDAQHNFTKGESWKGRAAGTYTIQDKEIKAVSGTPAGYVQDGFDYGYVGYPMLVLGSQSADWSPAAFDHSSQITQLQSDINLRVKTGDLSNQINISTEGILIDGSKTHITNTTTIDNGVIKTASIADAAITTAKISELAVNTAQIADAAINSAKIASLAVGTAQIADGAISTAKIGTAAITSAQIADASILDAKIVNLDGSKIVAHSITADQLDVNAIAVGLNAYGSGWQITPARIAFLPVAGSLKSSLSIDGTGIQFNDITNGEDIGKLVASPWDPSVNAFFNGLNVALHPNADYFSIMHEESQGYSTKFAWSNYRQKAFGLYGGLNFMDKTHFNYIGPMDPDDHAQMKVVRAQVGGRWSTGFMNSNADGGKQSGILFTDDGATYLGRAGKWYNIYDIVNKIGIA